MNNTQQTPPRLWTVTVFALVLSLTPGVSLSQEQPPYRQSETFNHGQEAQTPHLLPESTLATTFQTGDVFAAVSTGRVNWYRADGTLVKQLDSQQPGYTAGMAFDVSGNLYVTNFGAANVSRFDNAGNLLGTFGSGYSGSPESIVFDAGGNVYVGSVNGDNKIRKFDSAGVPLAQYAVAIERRGSDWIDLSTDQKTMFLHVRRAQNQEI